MNLARIGPDRVLNLDQLAHVEPIYCGSCSTEVAGYRFRMANGDSIEMRAGEIITGTALRSWMLDLLGLGIDADPE